MLFFFFFNDTATTEIYTLSLHDALPISPSPERASSGSPPIEWPVAGSPAPSRTCGSSRSEEHTSELQSRQYLVCRLLLEKKKQRVDPIVPLLHLTHAAHVNRHISHLDCD